jgi:hypothetical protein
MNAIKIFICITLMLLLTSINSHVIAQAKDAPAPVATALLIKLAGMEKNVSSAGNISVYVMGAKDIEEHLKKAIGKSIGKAKLVEVTGGDDLPTSKPTILVVGSKSAVEKATKYCRENKILSYTGIADLIPKGVALGVGVGDDNKPRIMLNLTASVEEGLDWNPAIMKVAKTVK